MALYRKRSGLKFVTLSYVLLLPQKKWLVNCCGKEYGQLTNPPSPPWVTSPWTRQKLGVVCGWPTHYHQLYLNRPNGRPEDSDHVAPDHF
jgi:hypothetical protein